jgi:hypothetical protein
VALVTPGEDVAAFIKTNLEAVEVVESWMGGKGHQRMLMRRNRRDDIFSYRMAGLAKAGKLTIEEGFKLIAWRRKVGIRPGFFENPERCD